MPHDRVQTLFGLPERLLRSTPRGLPAGVRHGNRETTRTGHPSMGAHRSGVAACPAVRRGTLLRCQHGRSHQSSPTDGETKRIKYASTRAR